MPGKSSNLGQFWQELKRRKVIHVIVVYTTAAFVLIELVNNVYETLRLPPWTPFVLLLILGIGLPVVIVFSWFYGLLFLEKNLFIRMAHHQNDFYLKEIFTGKRNQLLYYHLRTSAPILTRNISVMDYQKK